MNAVERHRRTPVLALAATLVVSTFAVLVLASFAGASPAPAAAPTSFPGLPSLTVVSSAPAGATGPDDLTLLPLTAHGAELMWTGYQNGIGTNGAPGSPGGPDQSTIAGYTLSGHLVKTINVTGKVDGLTADPLTGRLIATVNEDTNSSMYVVNVATGHADHFDYNVNLSVGGNGGSDSIAIWNGGIYIAHSNPNDTKEATQYRVSLNYSSHVATVVPLFYDDSVARNALQGGHITMALTDPDTTYVMPAQSHRFAGDLATVSQADGRLIFAGEKFGHLTLAQLNLTDNVSGNLPPIDGIAVATSDEGSLYVVDSGTGTVTQLVTDGWNAGTVFVTEPSDNGNPMLGVLNLYTGHITPLGNHFVSPKGIVFVPEGSGSGHLPGDHGLGHDGDGPHHDDRGWGDDGARGHEDHNGDGWGQFWAAVINGEN